MLFRSSFMTVWAGDSPGASPGVQPVRSPAKRSREIRYGRFKSECFCFGCVVFITLSVSLSDYFVSSVYAHFRGSCIILQYLLWIFK